MKNRKIPERSCVVTKEKLPKSELLRIVKNNEGKVFVDVTGKANGRGAYICNSADCLAKAIKNKGLERSLKSQIPEDVSARLKEELN